MYRIVSLVSDEAENSLYIGVDGTNREGEVGFGIVKVELKEGTSSIVFWRRLQVNHTIGFAQPHLLSMVRASDGHFVLAGRMDGQALTLVRVNNQGRAVEETKLFGGEINAKLFAMVAADSGDVCVIGTNKGVPIASVLGSRSA